MKKLDKFLKRGRLDKVIKVALPKKKKEKKCQNTQSSHPTA